MNLKNTTFSKILKVIAKLMRQPMNEFMRDGLLHSIEVLPIHNFRCNHQVRIPGRKWLAPLYRPVLGSFTLKPGMFVAVRENKKICDIEFVDPVSKESVTYSVETQTWREKQGYFSLIPPERLKGSLGNVVSQIIQLRRSQINGRQEVSGHTASSLISQYRYD